MESAPAIKDKGKGKGKGKGPPPPPNTSDSFAAHKNTQKRKRDAFKHQMEENRLKRIQENKKQKA